MPRLIGGRPEAGLLAVLRVAAAVETLGVEWGALSRYTCQQARALDAG